MLSTQECCLRETASYLADVTIIQKYVSMGSSTFLRLNTKLTSFAPLLHTRPQSRVGDGNRSRRNDDLNALHKNFRMLNSYRYFPALETDIARNDDH